MKTMDNISLMTLQCPKPAFALRKSDFIYVVTIQLTVSLYICKFLMALIVSKTFLISFNTRYINLSPVKFFFIYYLFDCILRFPSLKSLWVSSSIVLF